MKLGGRIAAAIEILDEINNRNRPASQALKDWGSAHRFAGSSDRNAIGNLVYDTLRKCASHGFIADSEMASDLVFVTLMRQWDYEAVELISILSDDRFAPSLPARDQLQHYKTASLDGAPDHVKGDLPQWCVDQFKDTFGEEWISQAQALCTRPPLDLRVNRLKQTREKVLAQLQHSLKNAKIEPGEISPDCIRIRAGKRDARLPNITAETAYQKGWIEVQDQGSQICSLLSGAKPGDNVLDYCAGAGGKTLALAAMMENKGQIHAYDSDKQRLAPIHERLKRAGTRNVQTHMPINGFDSDLARLKNACDLALVDAPCTGSGTWRRHPDAKWRLKETMLEKRIEEQRIALEQAANFVRPGGRLVYITCSLLPAENINQAKAFLERHRDFSLLDISQRLGTMFETSMLKPCYQEVGLILSPASMDMDGFYFCLFERTEKT